MTATVGVATSGSRPELINATFRRLLVTLFRSMAGPDATLDLLRSSVPPPPDAAADSDRKGG
jgi:hypothetical protein